MPNINVEVTEGLLRAIRLYCAAQGLTQKQVVVETLSRAFATTKGQGYFNGGHEGGAEKKAHAGNDFGKPGTRDVAGKAKVIKPDSGGDRGPGQGSENEGKSDPGATGSDRTERVLISGQRCQLCGAAVYEAPRADSSGTKWKCIGPRTHTMSPREAK